jgi:uncharacterized membrane protein YkvA (DUF1232 family)
LLLEPGTRDRLRLSWRLLRDSRVSSLKYVVPALLMLYVIWPLDSIPDLLPGLGQMDDLGAAVAAVMLLSRLLPHVAPSDVVHEHLIDLGIVQDTGRTHSAPRRGDAIDAQFSVRG